MNNRKAVQKNIRGNRADRLCFQLFIINYAEQFIWNI